MKRLERGRFVWPTTKEGKVSLTPAQLAMLLEGIDWRAPQRTLAALGRGIIHGCGYRSIPKVNLVV
jgi:transposase